MIKNKNCPLCKKELYSGIGKGCKMCGMLLEDKNQEFCSEKCRKDYKKIRLLDKKLKGGKKR